MAEEAQQAPAQDAQAATDITQPGQTQKTFSQEELDRIVEQRLARVKAQFKDYSELREKATKLDEIEEARASESEKLIRSIERANQQAQEATERERQATERANATLMRAAVIAEASRQHAIDPDAVYRLLDTSRLTLADGDEVQGVEESVKALLDERSYLAGRPQQASFDGGARQTAPAVGSNADLNAQIRRAAGFGT